MLGLPQQELQPCTSGSLESLQFYGEICSQCRTMSEQKAGIHVAPVLEPSKHIPPSAHLLSARVENFSVPWPH